MSVAADLHSLRDIPPLPFDFSVLLEEFAQIGAPTGQEARRANFIVEWFEGIRVGSTFRDGIDNVIVDLSGGEGDLWLFDAHTDTVFADASPAVVREGDIWKCPGILDNSLSCVLLMLLGRELLVSGGNWPLAISFSVGEEGEGNLRGILAVGQKLKARLRGAWALDGHLERATIAASGSKRWKLVWSGPGGHSWSHFGRPSAIHAVGEWIAALRDLAPWKPYYLTYNVGKISGGLTVTTISAEAECLLDLRSVNPQALEEASEAAVCGARKIAQEHGLEVRAELIGGRPAAEVPAGPLNWVKKIHADLGLPFEGVINSTNANGLLALGIPATSTGLARGAQIHSREEWLDLGSIPSGWHKLWKLVDCVTEKLPCPPQS